MKILLGGDSWSCGLWQPVNDGHGCILVHQGMELFLSELGHEVDNISIPGTSNNTIYTILKEKDLDQYDFIFLVFCNPFRDLTRSLQHKYFNIPDRSFSFDQLVSLHNTLIKRYYERLDTLQKPIYLLGNNKVDLKLLNSTHVKCLIPSIREWLYPGFIQDELVYSSKIFTDLLEKLDLDCLDKLLVLRDNYNNYPNIQKEYFAPDGLHLNYDGHKKLTAYLQDFMLAR